VNNKRRAPPKPKLRVEAPPTLPESLPWNATAEGVLRRALEEHDKQPYSELLIVGLCGGSVPEVFSFTRDKLRLVGTIEWAKLVMLLPRTPSGDRQD